MPLPESREQEAESGTAGPEPSPELKPSKLDAAPKPLEFLRTPFGGRLLVHKSFLYRQEKAVGDKVYWKCRRHAGLGCRGRAITRGARATVMRDHCHLPDEDSLQALPEASGDPQAPEGPGGHMEEPCEGVGPWPGPEESEPTPGQVLSKPALEEEEEGPRALPLLTLPPKKRSTLGLGEYLPPMPPFGAGQAGPLEFLRTCYGGSFLVHEHFLYKREKAVGDKVYWTCRDHTLHGCRSRAITQGQRVTVMRSHCHPPDVEGLEARRRQEKAGPDGLGAPEDKPLPAVDSSLCRRGPGPLALSRRRPRKRAKLDEQDLPDLEADPGGPEFLRTPLGGSFLVHNSFLYRREKAAGEKVYWTCRDQARMGCRSRAITQGRRVTVMRGHCHPPDLAGLEALRQREKRPGPAQRESPAGPEFLRTPLGGSFLVHDSFLYRREKAAGEKVYWTCRDQARMGCRSRAITQGQRIMVMRRHCHPPDLAGLEALRQRENLPNLTHWEGPEPTEPLEFLRTSLGGRFLVHDSFLYRKEKAAGGKVYWMCRDQGRTGCRSRAITQGQRVMVMRSHCHPPDLAGLEALRQRERLPGRAPQREPEKTQLLPDAQLGLETASAESQQSDGSTRDSQPDGESQ